MVLWFTIEGMASATSLILTILASLRAASRFEERVVNRGSIGLMDGPPILGPNSIEQYFYQQGENILNQSSSALLLRNDENTYHVDNAQDNTTMVDKDRKMKPKKQEIDIVDEIKLVVEEEETVSPLWEYTEAFRRAAILGLIFDELEDDDNLTINNNDERNKFASSFVSRFFTDIIRVDGKKCMNVRGGDEDDDESDTECHDDLAMAVAVEAGLLNPPLPLPSGGTSRVRGGGEGTSWISSMYYSQRRKGTKINNFDSDTSIISTTSNNPMITLAYWFVRELSAPLAVIPAWHKVLCTYWREQKEKQMRKSQWLLLSPFQSLQFILTGRCIGQKSYDASHLDFDAYISGSVNIPCTRSCMDDNNDDVKKLAPSTPPRATSSKGIKKVRVKVYAPKTFRDLRTKCFRVAEGEYAKSILNAMNGAMSKSPPCFLEDESDDSWTDGDDKEIENNGNESMVAHILQDILSNEGHHNYKRARRRGIQQQTTMPYISFQSNSKGAARAGTFFFFTADGAFLIKTVKKEEAKAFLDMLPEYHRFMADGVNGRNSLLTRIFGMYSVRIPPSDGNDDSQTSQTTGNRWDGGLFPSSQENSVSNMSDDERIFLVMHSIFPSEASAFVTERFDLKGSTVGRECSQEERKSKGANAVLKDLDLKREVDDELKKFNENRGGRKRTTRPGLCIGRKRKLALMAQLERDVDLLRRCNVLDYSLLVGVVDMEMNNGSEMRESPSALLPKLVQRFFHWIDFPMPYYGAGMTKVNGGALSSLRGSRKGKEVVFYLGVIDFLQPWTIKKRLERDLKGLAGYDKSAISCVTPTDYADRFLKFVDVHVT